MQIHTQVTALHPAQPYGCDNLFIPYSQFQCISIGVPKGVIETYQTTWGGGGRISTYLCCLSSVAIPILKFILPQEKRCWYGNEIGSKFPLHCVGDDRWIMQASLFCTLYDMIMGSICIKWEFICWNVQFRGKPWSYSYVCTIIRLAQR